MKTTVQLSFKDKETGKQYKPGQTFESTLERIDEINKALKGALKVITEPTTEIEVEEKPKRKRRSKKS